MADKSPPVNGIDSSVEEALQRLSKKPGVRAWLMLDRTTGALLKTNGQIATVRPPKNLPSAESSGVDAAAALATPTVASFSTSDTAAAPGPEEIEDLAARELGGMVWGFLSTAGSLVQEMDTEDELKLLRLRTKKQEFVIVPEPKYLLVVVHDSAPA